MLPKIQDYLHKMLYVCLGDTLHSDPLERMGVEPRALLHQAKLELHFHPQLLHKLPIVSVLL